VSVSPLASVRARVGDWESPRTIASLPLVVRPPGLRFGPLLAEWDREGFVAHVVDPAMSPGMRSSDAAWTTAGLVMRDDQARAREGEKAGEAADLMSTWIVYIEGRFPRGASVEEDELRVYLGPRGAERGAVVVRPRAGENASGNAGRGVRVSAAEDRWSCWVTVPMGAIEKIEGRFVLRVGVVRETGAAGGQRLSWPRPMLPWQGEPGRALIDLSTWSR
jgi:hypothetical protein